ncbi:MAG: hypothetical protein WDN30_07660 [Pararobbsia sp.]
MKTELIEYQEILAAAYVDLLGLDLQRSPRSIAIRLEEIARPVDNTHAQFFNESAANLHQLIEMIEQGVFDELLHRAASAGVDPRSHAPLLSPGLRAGVIHVLALADVGRTRAKTSEAAETFARIHHAACSLLNCGVPVRAVDSVHRDDGRQPDRAGA